MSPLIWLASSVALVAGLGAGWALGVGRGRGCEDTDWKTRLAARDVDVQKSQEELADLAVALQEAEARLAAAPTDQSMAHSDPGEAEAALARERARADALSQRLKAAEDDLADLSDLEVHAAPATDARLAQRIEELEVELAVLASHRCPDPARHTNGAVDQGGHTSPGTDVAAGTAVAATAGDPAGGSTAGAGDTPAP